MVCVIYSVSARFLDFDKMLTGAVTTNPQITTNAVTTKPTTTTNAVTTVLPATTQFVTTAPCLPRVYNKIIINFNP